MRNERPDAPCISRRTWLRRVAALAVCPVAVPSATPDAPVPDPRLTARPYPPRIRAEPGLTTFGEQLGRGGLLYVPRGHDPEDAVPFVLALHGSGGSADRWSALFETCDTRGVALLAPSSRERTWDRVNGDFGPDVGFIDSALRYAFDRLVVDPTRIAMAGFSDGASYTLSLGPSNGDLFTHLIAWSPGFTSPAEPIVGQPRVFVSHGRADRVLPVQASRDGIVPIFEMDGYETRYLEFDGVHEMPTDVVDETFDWFLSEG